MLKRRIWQVLVRGALLSLAVGVCITTPAVARAGVVAVCADGSIMIAKKWADVNCAGAIEVAPDDVPPIGSGIRPRSIAWASFLREQEAMRRESERVRTRANRVSGRAPVDPTAREDSLDQTRVYRSGSANGGGRALSGDAARRSSAAMRASFTLTADERRDLALLVDLSQRDTPAILKFTQNGVTTARLKIAHSRAFEAKLRAHQRTASARRSGPVLVFSIEPANADAMDTPLSFVQGGPSFRPNARNSREFGWIDDFDAGAGQGTTRLGYIVLPESFEVSRPLAVFWGDAVVGATLRR
jgi:hypothetical protein